MSEDGGVGGAGPDSPSASRLHGHAPVATPSPRIDDPSHLVGGIRNLL